MNKIESSQNIPWLDGLRGFAALWVLSSHIQILSGMHYIKVLSWGELAVDLFMMLSGFLMAHHYIHRRDREPWESKNTIYKFWLRRFFRIAPLFYILLITALFLGPWLGDCRQIIASHWPSTATPIERYNDNSFLNLLTHITFVFGFLPQWAFRTPLPDWSIGLEMQFYFAFPFIMLCMMRLGPIVSSIILVIGCILFNQLFPEFFKTFQMPSFLLIKLYVFLIGIWIAYSRHEGQMLIGYLVALSIGIIWFLIERSDISLARLGLLTLMFYLMDNGTLPGSRLLKKPIQRLRLTLSNKISVFLGDTSYASYLLHLLIVIPVAAWLTKYNQYMELGDISRFFTCLLLSVLPVYLGAWLLYNHVEKNGIALGKRIINMIYKKV